jgi:3-dehydroquinate synthase
VRLGAGETRNYDILIGANALAHLGAETRRALTTQARCIALISNPKVFDLYGQRAMQSLRASGFNVSSWLMKDGERYKSLRTLGGALDFLAETKLERSDAVVALGGGVVGDLAGFAAAVYLRGVPYIQVPTTLLAQVDSSVGGKTAVNTTAGKNLVGAFHQPRAVLIDTSTLKTLPPRELTAGWCEAVKQGAAGSRKLFDDTTSFLRDHADLHRVRAKNNNAMTKTAEVMMTKKAKLTETDASTETSEARLAQLIAAQCEFKASIVANDEREEVSRGDARSRRILNLGHTTAHALEAVTHYRRFRHGEAVGYGLLVAGEISNRLGMLDAAELESLREAVQLTGRLPHADDLDLASITRALAHDKKNVGGQLKWVLLERLGRARIIDGSEISSRLLRASLRAGLQRGY